MGVATGVGQTRPDGSTVAYQDPIESIEDVDISSTNHTVTGVGRCLYVDVAGTVIIVDPAGVSHTFTALAVGIWHPMRVASVTKTGTTATGIKIGR